MARGGRAGGRTVTEWTLVIPVPGEWLTANVERYRYKRSALVKAWRTATVGQCVAGRLPTGITPVDILAVIRHPGRAPVRDRLNLAPTIKALVDALTPGRTFTRNGQTYRTAGYGLLPDDSDRHVRSTDWRLERDDKLRRAEVVLTIRETT